MTREEIERANAAHNLEATRFVSSIDLEATQFVSLESVPVASRRRTILLPTIILGIVFAAALLAVYFHREAHPSPAHTVPINHY